MDRARAEGRLLESDGFSSAEEAFRFFEDRFSEAVADGWGAIRVLGDMARMVDAGLDEANMTAFEMRYEHILAKQFPVVSRCQYDARRFSGGELLHTLKCHTDTFDQPVERFLAG